MGVESQTRSPTDGIKVDLGCGGAKRDGFIGIDFVAAPGVDHVLDLTRERYPFEDNSVDQVYSSHFLEHIAAPDHVFQEIGRICRDGARIEIWTPYAFSNEALLYGHVTYLTEEAWLHFCCYHRDTHLGILGGRWLLHNVNYVVLPDTTYEMERHGFPIGFALRYFKGVAVEFGVDIEFRRNLEVPAVVPEFTYSHSRWGPRVNLGQRAEAGPLKNLVRSIRSRIAAYTHRG